jgi:hypothetical protein
LNNRSTLALLDSLRPLYPGGVPCSLIKALNDKRRAAKSGCKVVFVSGYKSDEEKMDGAGQELLNAAITKGLKLSLEQTRVLEIAFSATERELNAMQQEILRTQPQVVVFLGDSITKVFGKYLTDTNLTRGKWGSFSGIPVIMALGLDEILKNPALKKEFWYDLKPVLENIEIAH